MQKHATKPQSVPTRQTRQSQRAVQMAQETVDGLTDAALPAAEKAVRKQRLVKVPDELRPEPAETDGASEKT